MNSEKRENSVDVLCRYFRSAEQAVKSSSHPPGVVSMETDSEPSVSTPDREEGHEASAPRAKRPRLGCDASCNFIRSLDASYCVCPVHDIAIDGSPEAEKSEPESRESLRTNNFKTVSVPLYGEIIVGPGLSTDVDCDSSDDEMRIETSDPALPHAGDVENILEDLIISISDPSCEEKPVDSRNQPDSIPDPPLDAGALSNTERDGGDETGKIGAKAVSDFSEDTVLASKTVSGKQNIACPKSKFKNKRDCDGDVKVADESVPSNDLQNNDMNFDSPSLSDPKMSEDTPDGNVSNLKTSGGGDRDSRMDAVLESGSSERAGENSESSGEFSGGSLVSGKANMHSGVSERGRDRNLNEIRSKKSNADPSSDDVESNGSSKKRSPVSEIDARESPSSVEAKLVAMLNEQINIICSMEETVEIVGLSSKLKYSIFGDSPTRGPQTCSLETEAVNCNENSPQILGPEQPASLSSQEIVPSSNGSSSEIFNYNETGLSVSIINACNAEDVIPRASNVNASQSSDSKEASNAASDADGSGVSDVKESTFSAPIDSPSRISTSEEAPMSSSNTNDAKMSSSKLINVSASVADKAGIDNSKEALASSSDAKIYISKEIHVSTGIGGSKKAFVPASSAGDSLVCNPKETNISVGGNANNAQIRSLNEVISCSNADRSSVIEAKDIISNFSDNESQISSPFKSAASSVNSSQICNSKETNMPIPNNGSSQIDNSKGAPLRASDEVLRGRDSKDMDVSRCNLQMCKLNETIPSIIGANDSESYKLSGSILSTSNDNESQISELRKAIPSGSVDNDSEEATPDAEDSKIAKLREADPLLTQTDGLKICKLIETIPETSRANGSQICKLTINDPSSSPANPSRCSESERTPIPPSVVRKFLSGEGFLLRKSPAQAFGIPLFNASKVQDNLKSPMGGLLSPLVDAMEPRTDETDCTPAPNRNSPLLPDSKHPEAGCGSAKHLELGQKESEAGCGSAHGPDAPEEEPKVLVQTLPVMSLSMDQKSKSPKGLRGSFSPSKHLAATILQEEVTQEKRARKKKVLFDLEEPQPCSSKVKEIRHRIHGLSFHVKKGRGIKLKHIESIRSNLKKASPSMLRILHYVLFGIYGQDQTDSSRARTIRNISRFSGFPFNEDSEEFEKKHVCLSRIPLPVLVEIQTAVMGRSDGMRCEIAENLLAFFMAPERIAPEEIPDHRESPVEASNADLDRLKDCILKGPEPVVVLERLQGSIIDKMAENVQKMTEGGTSSRPATFEYCKPHFIFDGPGITLKKLRKVRRRVHRARKEVISLLHYILYGRTENLSEMRLNILEFNGFADFQKEFADIQPIILPCLTYTELQQICDVLNLYATGYSKKKRVNKILKFIYCPYQPPDLRSRLVRQKRKMQLQKAKPNSKAEPAPSTSSSEPSASSKSKEEVSSSTPEDAPAAPKSKEEEAPSKPKTRGSSAKSKKEESNDTVSSTALDGEKPVTETASDGGRSKSLPKLADFKKIRENVECATPKDLLELNDLLLFKPSDEWEIHQNILQTTQFTFAEDSMDFRARKMMLNYMPLETMKKVAQLLDLGNCEKMSTKEELSALILKFLTNMVQGSIEENQDCEISSTAYIHRMPPNSLKNSTLYTNIQPVYFSPTDEELEEFISRVVTSGLWSCKDEDLMELVSQQYPVINLEEKEELIKRKTKEIVQRTKKKAFNSLAKTEECWYSKPEEGADEYIDVMT